MELLKVLVVDDEPGIRAGIKRVLDKFTVNFPFVEEAFYFETTEADSAEIALKLLTSEQFDILLLDNKLPGMEGIELLEILKNQQNEIITVMITSYASLDLAVRATDNGAFDFVPKPFTPQELKTAVESIAKHLFLRRTTKKMQAAGKEVRFKFLSVLSHELKAPLNAIEGYLDLMRVRQAGDAIENYDEMIRRSLDRVQGMRNLIMDMLDLTRAESGKRNRNLTTFNIRTVAEHVFHTFQPYAIQRDISVLLDCPQELAITADIDEIEIILNNLVSNAVKYNSKNGKVNVLITKIDTLLTMQVTDTGIGMNEEEVAKLFHEFVRIKNVKTKNISGSGLGLSIIKKIAETYGGTAMVKSTPDVGTTFTVTLRLNN
ncbi:MAG TPA: hypothetical protein DCQ31_10435 [Bacteroidales bacterium]|nr:hypothetical protein [Bacteroidales bacterium]